VTSITKTEVVGLTEEGHEVRVPAHGVVVAMGSEPDRTLVETIRGQGVPMWLVGDCKEPRMLLDAVAEGYEAGCIV
jgi:hypothetical protein